jgi:Collagen triple helix repeat (20 copies)
MRRRLSYANVAATLALVFAMSGGALAANHYLINSTKQINPKVLRKLKGARGPRGTVGPNGLVGPQGVAGETGQRGKTGPKGDPGFSALSQLPTGSTESGDFALSAQAASAAEPLSTAITFSIPLTTAIAAPNVEFTSIQTPGTHCAEPGKAQKGFLCIYVSSIVNLEAPPGGSAFDPEAKEATAGSGKFGAGLSWKATAAGPAEVSGTYSVTAG